MITQAIHKLRKSIRKKSIVFLTLEQQMRAVRTTRDMRNGREPKSTLPPFVRGRECNLKLDLLDKSEVIVMLLQIHTTVLTGRLRERKMERVG